MPKIFLIDDEKAMTQLVGALLGIRGYAMTSENDPNEGLRRLLDEDCDAIIVDLMMPGMDGLALVGSLRESPRHARTPIVVLSGKNLSDAERKALLIHKVRFVPKPITPSKLMEVVRESLRPSSVS